ncbi:hypothetical protein [Streptomyces sp. NPDC005012]|uniref:hypothetical protein n=1 Tax=Streptomyces sp. NPDC005012 TaxID=3154558 RepID=UPI0033A14DC6
MEQSIGSNTKPLTPPAAVDPALIPGLTVPVAADGTPEDPARDAAADEAAVVEDAAPEPEEAAESGAAADAAEDAAEEAAEEPAEDSGAVPDGPVFEAKDFRARMVADHAGVRLSLDDQECDFRWDEIGAVETSTSRFGKRYTVVVHTPERRWYWIEIDAKSRADVARWETELDAVLDAYFEDASEEPAEPAEAAGAAEAGAAGAAEAEGVADGDKKQA